VCARHFDTLTHAGRALFYGLIVEAIERSLSPLKGYKSFREFQDMRAMCVDLRVRVGIKELNYRAEVSGAPPHHSPRAFAPSLNPAGPLPICTQDAKPVVDSMVYRRLGELKDGLDRVQGETTANR
jgi:hypothetical protein